jgi:hypothetical protein
MRHISIPGVCLSGATLSFYLGISHLGDNYTEGYAAMTEAAETAAAAATVELYSTTLCLVN